LQVGVSSTSLPAGASVQMSLKVVVDGSQKTPVWRQHVSFDPKNPGDANVKLEVVSEVKGLLRFVETQFLVPIYPELKPDVSDKDQASSNLLTKRFVFYATDPIQIRQLQVVEDSSDPAVSVAIHEVENGKGELVLTIDRSHIGNEPIRLAYHLKDKASGRTATIAGAVASRSAISIVPSLLRVVRNDEGILEANAMVLCHASARAEQVEGEASATVPVNLEVFLQGRRIKAKVSQSGSSFARVKIEIPADCEEKLREDLEPQIKFDVFWGEIRARAEKKLLLPNGFIDER